MRLAEILKEDTDAYLDAARENVERFLGDVVADPSDIEAVGEAAWSLAHDAVLDIGGSPERATHIANQVKTWYS